MQAILTPVAEAFHQLPEARPLSCGVTAHLVDPSNIRPARATRFDRHDRITRARHSGWYADEGQFDILTGFVYAYAEEPDEQDDDPPATYYALVESNDTDCHYLDPDAYDDPVTAAQAADRMAELVAELERECDAIRNRAIEARLELAEANRVRRDALGILRHVRACPADAESLGPAFRRLWRQADAGRRRAFDIVGEHRPPPRERPFDPAPTPTRDECLADAWRDGWDCGAGP
ncbi:MAG: hypothetical protein OXI79_03395 [Gammaproteobacteria bacterium]|nr:hypothetical protein [Gammaproteobacteria bacterium]